VVAGIRDQALLAGYVRNLAGWLGMDPGEVGRAVTAARNTAKRSATAVVEPPSDGSQADGSRSDGAAPPPRDEPSITKLPNDYATRLERDALMAMLQYPQEVGADLVRRASEVQYVDHTLAVVRDAVGNAIEHIDSQDWLTAVSNEVPLPFATLVRELGIAPIPERPDYIAVYCRGVVSALIDRDLQRQKRDLLGSLQRLDATAEPERYAALQRDLVRIETERRNLRAD
jgi:DNA primase